MTRFVIQSASDNGRLAFESEGPVVDGGQHFRVTFQSTPLSATVSAYEIEAGKWAAFFADLAVQWRGWPGSKEIESLEGDVSISATSDPLGHVRLRICLRNFITSSDWSMTATIDIEAGQLAVIAKSAGRFSSKHISGEAEIIVAVLTAVVQF